MICTNCGHYFPPELSQIEERIITRQETKDWCPMCVGDWVLFRVLTRTTYEKSKEWSK